MPFAAGPTFTAPQKGWGPRAVKQLNPDSTHWRIWLENLPQYLQALHQLDTKHMRRALKSAMTKLCAELRRNMRQRIPIGRGEFNDGTIRGHLRQAIKSRVVYYTNRETVFGVVGVERGKGRRLSDQGYTGWFHHEGTKPHKIVPSEKPRLVFRTKSGVLVKTVQVNHPGNKPNPFVFDATKAMRSQFNTTMAREIDAAVRKQAAKAQVMGKA